ncbi:MAG TPA: hypothetical protein VKB49_27620, partial [Candidatus Sulfotelmatobacter sp.]|nr:hypothetical protein [Candidatus Sulfotelmatobacter sp.]
HFLTQLRTVCGETRQYFATSRRVRSERASLLIVPSLSDAFFNFCLRNPPAAVNFLCPNLAGEHEIIDPFQAALHSPGRLLHRVTP